MAFRNPRQTRERLVITAFEEIHAHGFQGLRVDEVLRRSGLQKGAFYHHFGSKTELGYAVLEEQIRPLLESLWLKPLAEIQDPIEEFPRLLDELAERMPRAMLEHGCPLNNLAQEMASQDEGFRERIVRIFDRWIDGLAAMFEAARRNGKVRDDIDSRAVARFLIAAIEGCIGVFKVEHAPEQWVACRSGIQAYLDTLRPETN